MSEIPEMDIEHTRINGRECVIWHNRDEVLRAMAKREDELAALRKEKEKLLKVLEKARQGEAVLAGSSQAGEGYMNCGNPGCSFTAEWECRTSDGKVKNLCQKCYLNEGYNKFPERADAIPIGEEVMEVPAIRRKVGGKWKWQYTWGAAAALSRLYRERRKWRAVARLLGVTEGSLSVYASNLRKRGFTVGARRDTEAEPVRNREVGAVEDTEVGHDTEMERLQRQRIAALEEALRKVEAIIDEVLEP